MSAWAPGIGSRLSGMSLEGPRLCSVSDRESIFRSNGRTAARRLGRRNQPRRRSGRRTAAASSSRRKVGVPARNQNSESVGRPRLKAFTRRTNVDSSQSSTPITSGFVGWKICSGLTPSVPAISSGHRLNGTDHVVALEVAVHDAALPPIVIRAVLGVPVDEVLEVGDLTHRLPSLGVLDRSLRLRDAGERSAADSWASAVTATDRDEEGGGQLTESGAGRTALWTQSPPGQSQPA